MPNPQNILILIVGRPRRIPLFTALLLTCSVLIRPAIGQDQNAEMILRWKNGDKLPGKLLESVSGTVRWSSPRFRDDLILNPDVLDLITFPRKTFEAAGAFRLRTVAGDVLAGELAGADDDQFLFFNPFTGLLRIHRDAVYSIDRLDSDHLLFDGSSYDEWFRRQVGPLRDVTYTVYPGRWRPGYPDFRKLNDLDQGWLQTGYVDLGLTDFEDLFALVFEGRIEAPEAGEYAFSIDVDDQARLSIDGKKVLITESGGSETVRLRLSSGFHSLRLEYLEYGSGEHLDVWWSGPGFENEPLSGRNSISGWRRGPSGFPETYRAGALLFHPMELPDLVEIDLEIFSTWNPRFVFGIVPDENLGNPSPGGLRLEVRENELLLAEGDSFEKVLTIEPEQRSVRVRCFFNRSAGTAQVFDEHGQRLAQVVDVHIPKGGAGLYIQNQGENLQVRRWRVYSQNTDTPCVTDEPAGLQVRMSDGRVLSGSFDLNEEYASITSSDGTRHQLDMDGVDHICNGSLAVIDDPKRSQLVYSDGTMVRGTLDRIETDHLVLQTAISETPISFPLEGAVLFEFGPSAGWESPGSGNSDLLFATSGPMHGQLLFDQHDSPMAWKPEGAESALRTGDLDGAHIERSGDRISTDSFYNPGDYPHLLHLKNGEVLPCQVFSLTDLVLDFQSPLVMGGKIHPAYIKAIEFNVSAELRSTAEWSRKLDQWLDEILVPEDETYLGLDSISLGRALMQPRLDPQNSVDHLLVSKTGDVKRGRLLEIRDQQIQFESSQRRLFIPIERLACVVDVRPMVDETAVSGDWARFFLSDGSNVVMSPESSMDGELTGRSTAYGKAEIPIANIQRITFGESPEPRAESRFKQWLMQPLDAADLPEIP